MGDRWLERYEEHVLWVQVEKLGQHIQGITMPEDEDLRADLARIQHLHSHLDALRAGTPDPRLVPGTAMDGASPALVQLNSYLDGVTEDDDSSIESAAGQVDGVLGPLAGWPPLTLAQTAGELKAAVDSVRTSASATIDALSSEKAQLESRLGALLQEATSLREKIDEDRATFEEALRQFSQSSESTVADLVSTQTSRFDDLAEEWGDSRAAQDRDAQTVLSQLVEYKTEAENMVHATTASTVATDYGKYARNKTFAAWTCDVGAALVGAVGVAAIIYHLYNATNTSDGGSVGLSLTRLAASLGTLGIATLIGRRGQQHHREARAAKRTDLALRRVGPFMANLPHDVQQDIVEDMTQRIFIEGRLDDPRAVDGALTAYAGRLAARRKEKAATAAEGSA